MISNSYVELPEGMRFPSTQKTAPEYGTKIGIIKISLGSLAIVLFRYTLHLVGGLEHVLFSHILGNSSSQLTFNFFRGVETTNQNMIM